MDEFNNENNEKEVVESKESEIITPDYTMLDNTAVLNAPKPKKVKKGPAFAYLPIWLTITLFVIGFIGLDLVTELISLILIKVHNLSGDAVSEYFMTPRILSSVNLVRYAIIFLVMILILYFNKRLVPILQGFKRGDVWAKAAIYYAVGIGFNIVWNTITNLIQKDVPPNLNQTLVENVISSEPLISLIWIPFLGPIVEELTYRVGLYGFLRRYSKALAFIVSGLIFGLIHFDFTVFTNFDTNTFLIEVLNIPTYIFSGLLFCHAYEKYDIQVPIAAHIINNSVSYPLILIMSLLAA